MKKNIFLLLVFFLFIAGFGFAQKPAYAIFDARGKKKEYDRLLNDAGKAQVVFFGELHDNPISHWLELELTIDLFEIKQDRLILAAEMFETDDQLLLNEYTSKFIRKRDFEQEAKLWPNYKTDYAPLVDFAREKGLKFIGSNIPRRYAAIVNFKDFGGLDSINAYQRALIAPLPIKYDSSLNCYASMKSVFSEGGGPMAHQVMHLEKAQAIKDATMGWFIIKNLSDGYTLLHFNGSYHSDDFQGTVWYAKDYARKFPFETRVLTISCVEQDALDALDESNTGKADYIIVIPTRMTKTY